MTSRTLHCAFLACALIASILSSPVLHAETPNIIVILVDDMGYGDLDSYNPNAQTTTPHLDALAAAGMSFTDFHTNSAVCTPSCVIACWLSAGKFSCAHACAASGSF